MVRKSFAESVPNGMWSNQSKRVQRWQKGLAHLRQFVEEKGHANIPVSYFTKDNYNLGTWVQTQRAAYKTGKLSLERRQALEQIPGWMWKNQSKRAKGNRAPNMQRWQQWLARLRQFVEEKGHANVPSSYFTQDNYSLGTWVQVQRAAYKKGKLSLEQQQALEETPGWMWRNQSKRAQRWQQWLARLRQFVEEKGHANVPSSYVTKDNYSLGTWVRNQRVAYKKRRLSLDQQQFLDSIPGWVWRYKGNRVPNMQRWQEWLARLRQFLEEKGHANVPSSYVTQDNYSLGTWVQSQRGAYNKGVLSSERRQALEQIPGWTWESHRKAYRWNECYNYLCEYVKCEGHSNVPGDYKTQNGFHLVWWVRTQRSKYSQGELSVKHRRLLERIPGWLWHIPTALWAEHFKRLCKYVKREGNALVPRRYVEKNGFKLGLWAMSQRERYRQRRLSKERQKMLEQLPGWFWNPRRDYQKNDPKVGENQGFTAGWSKSLRRLCEYSSREGHACVPATYISADGYKLGTWVRDQRYQHGKGKRKLSKEQEEALEQIPGWSWDESGRRGFGPSAVRQNKWMTVFEKLRNYTERYGSSCAPFNFVTEDGFKLGLWVMHQRQVYKKGKLSLERQRMLEQLPDWKWRVLKTYKPIKASG